MRAKRSGSRQAAWCPATIAAKGRSYKTDKAPCLWERALRAIAAKGRSYKRGCSRMPAKEKLHGETLWASWPAKRR